MNLTWIIGGFLIIIALQCDPANGQQNLLQLSYPNADNQQQRPGVTPSTTTPVPEVTTKKSFFGGIKSFFSGGAKTSTTSSTSTTTTTSTTQRPAVVNTTPRPVSTVSQSQQPSTSTTGPLPRTPPSPTGVSGSAISQAPVSPTPTRSSSPPQPQPNVPGGQSSTQWGPTPTQPSARPPQSPIREEFPALPTRRTGGNTPQSPSQPAPQSAWGNVPSSPSTTVRPGMVQFVSPQPTPSGQRPWNPMGDTTSTTAKPIVEGSLESEVVSLSETLFTKDSNNPSRLVTANYQTKTVSYSTGDDAPNPLLTLDEAALANHPTISKMRLLYNNYELDASVNEHSTPIEKREENEFIDAVLATQVMRQAMLFLQKHGKVSADPQTHKDLLKTIWFNMYSRGQGRIGSSGFEHVFLTEMKNNSIVGLHNWVYFADEEKAGHVDYKGYIKKIDLGNKGAVVKLRFSYNNINKPVNGVFVGTSPELELALYTVCFEMFPDNDCILSADGNQFKIKTYTFRYRGKNLIGSAYPEVI